MNALTPITPQSPMVDIEHEVELIDHLSGLHIGGIAGFDVEATNYGGHYFNRDVEYTATIEWFHVGRMILGRKDLTGMFGNRAVEAAEVEAAEVYTRDHAGACE